MKTKALILSSALLASTVSLAANDTSKVAVNPNLQPTQVGQNEAPGPDTFASADFESTFPPAGWTIVQTNTSETWKAYTTGITGNGSGQVAYDAALSDQDEWLVSPVFYAQSGTVDVSHFGSVYWGVTPNDNYNLDVMLVIDGVGGTDDILLKRLEEDWVTNWTAVTTEVDFTASIPSPYTPIQIAFRYTGNDGAQAVIDDVLVSGVAGSARAPSVPVPTLNWIGMLAMALALGLFATYRRKA